MRIQEHSVFTAPAPLVMAMLQNKEFIEKCCAAAQPLEYLVQVDGATIRTAQRQAAPDAVKAFARDGLILVGETTWHSPEADGSCCADVALHAEGLPMQLAGTIALCGQADTTVVAFDGELKVSVPIFGPKIEAVAAADVVNAIRIQEQEGIQWLATH